MGHAILSGILSRLTTHPTDLPTRFILTVGRSSSIESLQHSLPADAPITILSGAEGNLGAIRQADIILLACKPYMAQGILAAEGVKDALKGKVLASVLAGVTMAQLEAWAPGAQVVRTMTNTPSKVRASRGASRGAERRRRAFIFRAERECQRRRQGFPRRIQRRRPGHHELSENTSAAGRPP